MKDDAEPGGAAMLARRRQRRIPSSLLRRALGNSEAYFVLEGSPGERVQLLPV